MCCAWLWQGQWIVYFKVKIKNIVMFCITLWVSRKDVHGVCCNFDRFHILCYVISVVPSFLHGYYLKDTPILIGGSLLGILPMENLHVELYALEYKDKATPTKWNASGHCPYHYWEPFRQIIIFCACALRNVGRYESWNKMAIVNAGFCFKESWVFSWQF